jgi:WD40 repeat protein
LITSIYRESTPIVQFNTEVHMKKRQIKLKGNAGNAKKRKTEEKNEENPPVSESQGDGASVEEGETSSDVNGESQSSSMFTEPRGMSEYERVRLENIKRNEMFLSDLGLASVRSSLATSVPKKSKPTSRSKAAPHTRVPQEPVRRSGRVTTERLKEEIKRLKEEGNETVIAEKKELLDTMLTKQREGTYVPEIQANETSVEERINTEPISLSELKNYSEDDDKAELAKQLLSAMKKTTGRGTPSGKRGKSPSTEFLETKFTKLKLHEDDVVKMTPNRITAVALSSSIDNVIAVAGDKAGYMTLWNTSKSVDENRTFRYKPHISNIMKLSFTEDDEHKLFSFSYDGTIRCLDLQKEEFSLMLLDDFSDGYLTDGTLLNENHLNALVAKSTGMVSLVDFRASKDSYQWSYEAQGTKLNSIQQHPTNSHLIITAGSKNGGIAVHDLRKAGKNWQELTYIGDHTKSISAACVSPDGQYLLSVSLDDTIRVWKNFENGNDHLISTVYAHNNWTGRWLSTFRPTFDPKRNHTFVMGSMMQPRRIELFTIEDNKATGSKAGISVKLIENLEDENLASVNSRNCFHCKLEMVLGSNSSGKVHLFR